MRKKRKRHWSDDLPSFIAILALVVTVVFSFLGYRVSHGALVQATQQFSQSSKETDYNDIITGLSSESTAVQINSIRRLVQFSLDRRNFPSRSDQDRASANAVQTLQAYIKDRAPTDNSGLRPFGISPPDAALRAFSFGLKSLQKYGHDAVDLSHTDTHGVSASGIYLRRAYIVRSDLRQATLRGADLRGATLTGTFLTCAVLSGADLHGAHLRGTDFRGADLRGADLAATSGLTSASVLNAQWDDATRWPQGFAPTTQQQQSWRGADCQKALVAMTGISVGVVPY